MQYQSHLWVHLQLREKAQPAIYYAAVTATRMSILCFTKRGRWVISPNRKVRAGLSDWKHHWKLVATGRSADNQTCAAAALRSPPPGTPSDGGVSRSPYSMDGYRGLWQHQPHLRELRARLDPPERRAGFPISPRGSAPKLDCLRSSATYRTRLRGRSFTSVKIVLPFAKRLLVDSQIR
jgi:hypothetical protein